MASNRMSADRVRLLRLLAVSLAFSGLAGFGPARAQAPQEDTNPLNSVLGFIGMQFDKDRESIDYRARAPIVVPPRTELPKPKVASRDPSWPSDPDIGERRHAAAEAQRPAPQLTPQARVELSPAELAGGVGGRGTDAPRGAEDDCQPGAGTPICLYTPWKALQSMVGLGGGSSPDKVDPGVEPDRRYLTEPPSGYRKASAAATATIDAPKDQPDAGDAQAYNRAQRHKSSVDE
ncbi:hypothetical protein [Methylocella silvestris]|nr:hypothetical protein [Methylocella silvestris]